MSLGFYAMFNRLLRTKYQLIILTLCISTIDSTLHARSISSSVTTITIKELNQTAPGESSMPSWRQGQLINQWREIPNSSLSRVPINVVTYPPLGSTGPNSKVEAWCGFAIDERDSSVYSPANGGHADYAGNEVDRIRLSENAPAWQEIKPSTPPTLILDGDHYADGSPTSRHTYYGLAVNQQRNRIMLLGGAKWKIGFSTYAVDGFNLATNQWDPIESFPTMNSDGGIPGNGMTEIKDTGDIIMFANWNIYRWSDATNKWSLLLADTQIYGQYAATAHDIKRNRIFVLGGNSASSHFYDLNSNTVVAKNVSGAVAAEISGQTQGNALVYDPWQDMYYYTKGAAAGKVYSIDPETFEVKIATTTGAASMPPTHDNGVWKRFLFAPKLKGIIYAPTYNGNMWFLRTQ